MKKIIAGVVFFFLTAILAFASDYQYITAEQLKEWIETGKPFVMVDIQVEKDFEAHHVKGSMATYSYPVKSDSDKAKLADAVAASKDSGDPVVVVCPRGGGGAKRCYDHLKSSQIAEDRLLILKNGMEGWPYEELVETGK